MRIAICATVLAAGVAGCLYRTSDDLYLRGQLEAEQGHLPVALESLSGAIKQNPRMGLASHLQGMTNGPFLIIVGLLWPHLVLAHVWQVVTVALLAYGTYANWLATQLAAIWGAGSKFAPGAAGGHVASTAKESIVNVLLVSLAVTVSVPAFPLMNSRLVMVSRLRAVGLTVNVSLAGPPLSVTGMLDPTLSTLYRSAAEPPLSVSFTNPRASGKSISAAPVTRQAGSRPACRRGRAPQRPARR